MHHRRRGGSEAVAAAAAGPAQVVEERIPVETDELIAEVEWLTGPPSVQQKQMTYAIVRDQHSESD